MALLLLLKLAICKLGLGGYLIEFCLRCGRRVELVWWAPAGLWREIVGSDTGVRCARCFDRECYARGYLLQWEPVAVHVLERDGALVKLQDFPANLAGQQKETKHANGTSSKTE